MRVIDIKAIRERAEKATPGPWKQTGAFGQLFERATDDDKDLSTILGEVWHAPFKKLTEQQQIDIEFIINARQDIPALLAYIEQLEAAARIVVKEDCEGERCIGYGDGCKNCNTRKLAELLGFENYYIDETLPLPPLPEPGEEL